MNEPQGLPAQAAEEARQAAERWEKQQRAWRESVAAGPPPPTSWEHPAMVYKPFTARGKAVQCDGCANGKILPGELGHAVLCRLGGLPAYYCGECIAQVARNRVRPEGLPPADPEPEAARRRFWRPR